MQFRTINLLLATPPHHAILSPSRSRSRGKIQPSIGVRGVATLLGRHWISPVVDFVLAVAALYAWNMHRIRIASKSASQFHCKQGQWRNIHTKKNGLIRNIRWLRNATLASRKRQLKLFMHICCSISVPFLMHIRESRSLQTTVAIFHRAALCNTTHLIHFDHYQLTVIIYTQQMWSGVDVACMQYACRCLVYDVVEITSTTCVVCTLHYPASPPPLKFKTNGIIN